MREAHNPFLSQEAPQGQRLPTSLKPIHYDVQLQPDLDGGSFTGSVVIHFHVLQASSSIILNSVDLIIRSTQIISSSGKITRISNIHYDAARETIAVPLPHLIKAGEKIKLRHVFEGTLGDIASMTGFMRSSYVGFDGKKKWIASTQGQATGIRRIFPCLDEPALKATFSTTIVADEGLTVLSNMDVASEEKCGEGRKKVIFNKTPRMSSYLVAYVVSELNFIESNEYRVPVRLYVTPDQDIKGAQFALDVGARSMISHEKTFGLPYPLPKLDMVAVPGHSGGMENWGCVLYQMDSLVRDVSGISASQKENTAYLVIHEHAHQWFGDLVTASWWDSIWLNESFADWATYNALTDMFPEWESWSNFVAGKPSPAGGGFAYQDALTLDSNRGSHPIEVPVSTPDQISQIFDSITYAKGCSVLRMIADFLGVDIFIKGVQLHLRKHAFGNATTNELWESLSSVSGKDVQSILAAWTQHVGYPILSIEEDEFTNSIQVTQHRFLQVGDGPSKKDHSLYPIYLKTNTQKGIDQKSHLFDRTGRFSVDLGFYKLNAGQTGLYRVAYSIPRMEKFGLQLSLGLLSPDDRVGLLSDFRAIVASGHVSEARTSTFLDFISKFRSEENEFVWRQILVCFQEIRSTWKFEDTETLQALSDFQTDLMTPILDRLGDELWNFSPTDGFRDQIFKAVLFSEAQGYEPVKRANKQLFNKFISGDEKALDSNVRRAVFDHILSDKKATSSQYDSILHTFHTTTSISIRTDALYSLSSASSLPLVKRTLQLARSSELQSGTDKRSLLKGLSRHATGTIQLWHWLKRDWESLTGGPVGIASSFVIGLCLGGLSTREQYVEVKEFFGGKDTKKFDQVLKQNLDDIRGKAGWVERDREDVRGWLKGHGYYQ